MSLVGNTGAFVTYADAIRISEILNSNPLIQGVEIFGSVARQGFSDNDLDVIVLVTEECFQNFAALCMCNISNQRRRRFYFDASGRAEAARESLGADFDRLLADASIFIDPAQVDIFLLPADWRNREEELQNMFPHEDPEFMRTIAKDAKRI